MGELDNARTCIDQLILLPDWRIELPESQGFELKLAIRLPLKLGQPKKNLQPLKFDGLRG